MGGFKEGKDCRDLCDHAHFSIFGAILENISSVSIGDLKRIPQLVYGKDLGKISNSPSLSILLAIKCHTTL